MSDQTSMDSFIDAKVASALSQAGIVSDLDRTEVIRSIQWSPQEREYLAERGLYILLTVELGRQMAEAIKAKCRMSDRSEIAKCLDAYFEAVDAGEAELV